MAENLSQAVRYGGQFAPRVSMPERKDIIGETFESAAKSLAAVKQRKEAKEAQYKETREQIDSLNKAGMYQGHYDMLQEAAAVLKDPATIDEYASSPEKQIQYENMVDELNQSIDYYENYYTTTFGKSGDPANGITYSSELARQINPSMNIWGESGMEQVTTNEELTSRLAEISKGFHNPGSVTIQDGKLVYGEGKSILNQNLPAQPFKPELRAIEMSGAEYFAKIDNGSFDTKERMEAVMTNDLNRNSAAFQGIARHYINEQKKKNQSYDESIEELMTNAAKRQDVINFAVEEAEEVRRKPKTTTRTMTDSQRKEIQERQTIQQSLVTGALLSIGTVTTEDSSERVETLSQSLDVLDLPEVIMNGEKIVPKSISFLPDGSINVTGLDADDIAISGDEAINLKPTDIAYGSLEALIEAKSGLNFDYLQSDEYKEMIRSQEVEPVWRNYNN